MHVSIRRPGIIELDNGSRLIVRDGSEILVPKPASGELIKVLHNTYAATDTMILQCKNRIFWLKMRAELETCYEHCQPQMAGSFRFTNKSSSEMILKVREWGRTWESPALCVTDSGPGFWITFSEEAGKLGVRIKQCSAYNPSSQAAVERGTLGAP